MIKVNKTMFLICVVYAIYLLYFYTIRYVIGFFKALYIWFKVVFKFLIFKRR